MKVIVFVVKLYYAKEVAPPKVIVTKNLSLSGSEMPGSSNFIRELAYRVGCGGSILKTGGPVFYSS